LGDFFVKQADQRLTTASSVMAVSMSSQLLAHGLRCGLDGFGLAG
jgi:hypothetical protein